MELDDVHRAHREARAIHEAGDVAVETDVVQAEFARCDLTRIFLGLVAHFDHVLLTVESVVVEIELRIERHDLIVRGDGQRIDLHERAVALQIQIPHRGEELHGLIGQRTAQTERCGDFAALVGLQTERGVHELLENLLRGLFGHFFDVHAAFRGGDDGVAAAGAVKQDGEVVFLRNIDRFGDEHFAHQLALRAGLVRHERLAEHFARDLLRLLRGVHDVHAAFEAIFEGALAAAAGMNLGLHHEARAADLARGFACLLGRAGDDAFGGGDAEFIKQLLGLVFVDVHVGAGKGAATVEMPSEASRRIPTAFHASAQIVPEAAEGFVLPKQGPFR